MIEHSEYLLTNQALNFWKQIKIDPEKWNEHTMGKDEGGFWVVGVIGKRVLYYNHIEEGFNLSAYQQYGTIDEYLPNQIDLHDFVNSYYKDLIMK